jgi:hypothetical protein
MIYQGGRVEPRATSGFGLRVPEIRVYYDTASGDVMHIHRLVVVPGQEGDDRLRGGVEAFDQWLRSQYDGELDFLSVSESDIPSEGPIRIDLDSRILKRGI